MKPTEFQKFLFQSAVSAMAIDGEIHNSEVEEIETIVKHTAYFLDLDFDTELEANISNIKANGKDAINHYLQSFSNLDLSEKQEVILIEILLLLKDETKAIEPIELRLNHDPQALLQEIMVKEGEPRYVMRAIGHLCQISWQSKKREWCRKYE